MSKGAFTEAINYFASKEALSPSDFYALAAEARAKAFTVSGVTSLNVLKSLHAEVEKVLTDGGTLRMFQDAYQDILKNSGYAPDNPFHIETVFRQNIQTAYNVGRYGKQTERASLRPWWIYNSIDDSATTPLCYELGGHTGKPAACYRYDHPFWNEFYPPNHFNCRSSVDDLSDDDLTEEGITPLTEDITGQEYYPTMPDGSVSSKPEKLLPPDGFNVNPGKVSWTPDMSKFSEEERRLFEKAQEEKFGPVKTMGELNTRLNDLQENFRLIDVEAVPVKRIEFDNNLKNNGSWDPVRQVIGLNPDRFALVNESLKEGKITSLQHADAFSTLCHELGHTLGVQIDIPRYKVDTNYHNLSQIVNESWNRLFFPDFCKSLKLEDVDQYAEQIFQVRSTGYQTMISNFMQLMETSGMDRQEFSDMAWMLNTQKDPADYEKLLREKLGEFLPGVNLPESGIGESMDKTEKFQEWLDTIEGRRNGLNKEKGKIF